jgi:hypothetical protein
LWTSAPMPSPARNTPTAGRRTGVPDQADRRQRTPRPRERHHRPTHAPVAAPILPNLATEHHSPPIQQPFHRQPHLRALP